MKKITALTFGILLTATAFCQAELSLNLCGNTDKIAFSKLENCRSINVVEDGFKVFGFTISFEFNGMISEHKLDNNELTDKVISLIANHKPEKIYIENANVINVNGEASASKPLILEMQY